MAETIDGGAYLSADGKTWHDSEGKPLSKEQVKAAEQVAQEKTDAAQRQAGAEAQARAAERIAFAQAMSLPLVDAEPALTKKSKDK